MEDEIDVKLMSVERVEGEAFDKFRFRFDADGHFAEASFYVDVNTKGDLPQAEQQALTHVHNLAAAVKRATQKAKPQS